MKLTGRRVYQNEEYWKENKMKPIKFEGSNQIFAKGQKPYLPLPAYQHNDHWKCVSACWYLSFIERLKILFTGRIYTTLPTFGKPLTPQKLSVDNPVQEVKN